MPGKTQLRYQGVAIGVVQELELAQDGRKIAVLAKVDSPDRYFEALQQAGYATDPQYARKLKQVLRSDAIAGYSTPGHIADRNTEMEL